MTTEQMNRMDEERVTGEANARDEARRAASSGYSEQVIERLVERIGGRASAGAVFGEPITREDLTVIPVARVRWAFGGGSGSGGGPDSAGHGSGTGAGGGVSAEPLGHLEIRSSGATFKPIVLPYPSPLFLLVAGLSGALLIRAIARLVRG